MEICDSVSSTGQNRVMQRALTGPGQCREQVVKDREHWRRWRCIGEAWRKDCVQLESPGLGLWLLLWDKYKAIGEFGTKEKYKHPCVLPRFLLLCSKVICWRGIYRGRRREARQWRWPHTAGVRTAGFGPAEMKELRHVKTLDDFWR